MGTIEGRIHNEDHLKMWIGNPDTNDRLICSWVKDQHGKYGPEDPIFAEMENSRQLTLDFVVDVQKKKVVRV